MDFEDGINNIYSSLNERAKAVYEFVILYSNYIYANHRYGTEAKFNMMEIHILTHIDDNPGVTVTELSKIWRKTKSAISQMLKKLAEEGYVERRYKENNSKSVLFYVTEKGRKLSYAHKAYDIADISSTTDYLVSRCGKDDVDAFYRVLKEYTALLNEG